MGRDNLSVTVNNKVLGISIHSPRMGRDPIEAIIYKDIEISIHSPRMGRDG